VIKEITRKIDLKQSQNQREKPPNQPTETHPKTPQQTALKIGSNPSKMG
jgi:hypothetical protein